MRLNPLPALAFAVFLWSAVAQNSCSSQASCTGCLFVKDSAGITTCGWCRNPNISSDGFCTDRTAAAVGECTGTSPNSQAYLVLDSANCQVASDQNTLIAAVAGSVGGVLFAVVAIYIYYRKKKQKQERLASFRRRELEMHRSRKLKLDKELGMQSGAASINQRQLAMSNSALQMSKSASSSQMRPSDSSLQIRHEEKAPAYEEAPPAFQEPEVAKITRRRFKCMSKGGLRVRESPNSESAKVGGIKFEVVVTALSVKGNWVQVSANGWAMIASDDGSKIFLKELGEGDEADETAANPEVIVG